MIILLQEYVLQILPLVYRSHTIVHLVCGAMLFTVGGHVETEVPRGTWNIAMPAKFPTLLGYPDVSEASYL